MAQRLFVRRDGSLLALESSRSFRLCGRGRSLPHSCRRLHSPDELSLQLQNAQQRRERRLTEQADRKSWRILLILLVAVGCLAAKGIMQNVNATQNTKIAQNTSTSFFFYISIPEQDLALLLLIFLALILALFLIIRHLRRRSQASE